MTERNLEVPAGSLAHLTRRAWALRMATLACCPVAVARGRTHQDELPAAAGRVVPLQGTFDHPQGIEASSDGATWWVAAVDRARKVGTLSECEASTGRVRRQVEVQEGACYHPGGLSRLGDALWLPVAEYRRASTTILQQRAAASLDLRSQFTVADHIGCLAADATRLVGANWDARQFYAWDHAGRELSRRANPTAARYQDLKWVGEDRLVAGGLLEDTGVIDLLRWPSLRLERRIGVGSTDRGIVYTHEGLAVTSDSLLLLPEDDPVRVFVFPRPAGV